MKSTFKSILGTLFVSLLIISCSDDTDLNQPTESVDRTAIFDLVGTEEQRTASAEELNEIPEFIEKANCTLSGDEGCSDNASSEFERYVRECTSYTRNWPPSGAVNTYYRSMVYYVDGDSDINLDHYQDDLQAQVSQIVGSGGAAFVDADIIYWECNDRQNNSCVIQYSVYR
ncbi:hypothetical protein [Aquimarina litoralis]|uniref:hypothetical protein n=1 Tax=Aquimarina litoralis TaxID=584605 RepID=UPI001C578A52|nr:hypothetical protein [Aquimarina litoralis]MBW1296889.1 hypothetical protein [Aquimarina litoralis]